MSLPAPYVRTVDGVNYLMRPISIRDDGHFVVKMCPCMVIEDPDGSSLLITEIDDVPAKYVIQRNPLAERQTDG